MQSQSGTCVCIGGDAEKLAFLVLHDVAEQFISFKNLSMAESSHRIFSIIHHNVKGARDWVLLCEWFPVKLLPTAMQNRYFLFHYHP